MLTRNLLAAIQTFRVQQAILVVISRVGPATTRELAGYCHYRLPSVTHSKLQRLLTHLRRASALCMYRLTPDPSYGAVWALPGQPKPPKLTHQRPRRAVAPRPRSGPSESWWVQSTREGFQQALDRRWQS